MPTGAPASELLSDHSLSCRLERAEALAGARWIEAAGAYAMYDGPSSPGTQTFGLGLFQMPAAADMDTLEAFFQSRQAPVMHEVSPLADKALLPMLSERGYHPVELTSVMFLPLVGRTQVEMADRGSLRVRIAEERDCDLWARTAAEGWREHTEFADLISSLGHVFAATENTTAFLVECDGRAIATGALAIHNGVALLAGASTVPEWRHRGAQRMLLEEPSQVRRACRVRHRHVWGGAGERLSAKRRAPGIPDRLYPD